MEKLPAILDRSSPPSIARTTASSKSSTEIGRLCSKRLFTSYRLDHYNDPDSFAEQVAIIFAGYDDAVLLRVTDPSRRDCIQRTYKFPPSLQEISEALDNAAKAVRAAAFVEECESRGFHWNGRCFINAAGERYDPAKHRALPQSAFPIAPAD